MFYTYKKENNYNFKIVFLLGIYFCKKTFIPFELMYTKSKVL